MHNHIMKKSGRLQQKGSAPPSINMEKSSTCNKRASAHKIIYRKIRPRTAIEMNRRVRAEDGSHPLSHKIITGDCCAKSPVYKEKIIITYGHAAAMIRTPASNTGRQELTQKP